MFEIIVWIKWSDVEIKKLKIRLRLGHFLNQINTLIMKNIILRIAWDDITIINIRHSMKSQ